jgi:acyl-CoA thioesterase-2
VPDLWSDLLACLDPHRVSSGDTRGEGRAAATCPDKDAKSQHAVFSRERRADEPIRYQATRHHEGRSFATITARQSRGVVATSSICMHTSEDGPEHQVALDLILWEARATVDRSAITTGPPEFEVWMRTPAVDPALAPALAAYGTDLTLIGTALRPMDGVSQRGNGTLVASHAQEALLRFAS